MDSYGIVGPSLSLEEVYHILQESPGFRRIARIKENTEMVGALSNFGISSDAVIEGGKIIQKLKDDHGHSVDKEINSFKGEKGGHIRIESIENGVVHFGEFTEQIDT